MTRTMLALLVSAAAIAAPPAAASTRFYPEEQLQNTRSLARIVCRNHDSADFDAVQLPVYLCSAPTARCYRGVPLKPHVFFCNGVWTMWPLHSRDVPGGNNVFVVGKIRVWYKTFGRLTRYFDMDGPNFYLPTGKRINP